jgi:hypothetical protein
VCVGEIKKGQPVAGPLVLAGEEGLEPSHAGIKIRCLDQLGDSPKTFIDSAGFKLAFKPLPLLQFRRIGDCCHGVAELAWAGKQSKHGGTGT